MKIQKVKNIDKPKYPTFEEIKNIGKILAASTLAVSAISMSGCSKVAISGDIAVTESSCSDSGDQSLAMIGDTLFNSNYSEISSVTSPPESIVASRIQSVERKTSSTATSTSQAEVRYTVSPDETASTSTGLESQIPESSIASSVSSISVPIVSAYAGMPAQSSYASSIISEPSSEEPTETQYPGAYSHVNESSIVSENEYNSDGMTAGLPSQSIYQSSIVSNNN